MFEYRYDANGNTTQIVSAIDPTDINAPTLTINLQDDLEVTAPVNITGTIADSNLDYYTLEIAPVGSNNFKEVYRGNANVTGTIATFDPTVLANGAYVLKFTAFDANGNGSTTERTVNVAGDLKLGNFRLSFTDLSVPVAGIPINVTRTYDSLNANKGDDFGYGWRMELQSEKICSTSTKSVTIFSAIVNLITSEGQMDDLYDLLQQIKKRPPAYFGTRSIFHLQAFLDGYRHARYRLKLPETQQEQEFARFQPWLQKRFNIKSTQSWATIVFFYSHDEIHALDVFFELLEEFIIENKNSAI